MNDKDIYEKVLQLLNKNKFELVLFGLDLKNMTLPQELKKLLIEKKIKYEIMNSTSAYNTHNILLSEHRNFISILKLS